MGRSRRARGPRACLRSVAFFLGMVVAIGGIATPAVSAPATPERASQSEPDMPDAEGTDVDPIDLDRDQDSVDDATEAAEEALDSVDPAPVPAGALDGNAELEPTLNDENSAVLTDDDGDGVVHQPPTEVQADGVADVIEDPEADEELVGPEAPAEIDPSWDGGLGDLAEKAKEIDLTQYDEGEEIAELRTEGSRTFLDEDLKLRTQLSTQPMFSENSEGELVEPDSSPVGSRDGRWRPEAGYDGASVAANSGDDQLATIGFDPGQVLSWSLAGADAVPGEATDEGVRFDEVLEGVDLEVKVTPSGVKETLVLADASAPTVYDFPLDLSGLTLERSEGHDSIILAAAETGEPVGVIPGAWAVDSSTHPRGGPPDPVPVAYEIVGSGDNVVLRLKVDEAWLRNPARVFPVTVDPTAEHYRMTNDSWINSAVPSSTGGATTEYLKAGYADGAKRSYFVKWDVGWLANATIIEAVYKTFLNYSWSCSPRPFQVYRVTEGWSPGTVSWYDQPTFDGRALAQYNVSAGYSGCPAKWLADAPMRSLVQGWVDGTTPNYGLTGRAWPNDNYSDSATYKVFNSSEAGLGGGQYLEITWTSYRAAYAAGALVKPSSNTAGSMQVKVTNKSWLTWNKAGTNPYKLTYHIYHSDGTTLDDYDVGRASLPNDVGPFESAWVTIPLAAQPVGSWKYKFEMLQDMPSGIDHVFSFEGIHPDLTPMTVNVPINNVPPQITELEPAGRVDKTAVTLRALGENFDGYPADALQYQFKICTDVEFTKDCQTRLWDAAKTWTPPKLRWGKTYYWKVAVREGNGTAPRATTLAHQIVSFTPTVPQPKLEQHFGSDPYSTTYGGVNPSIGNYVTTFTDAQLPAAGLSVDLTRTYNSMDVRTGAFGPGWSTAIDTSATEEADGKVLIKYPDGRQERYAQNPTDGTTPAEWVGGAGNGSTLINTASDGWQLTRPDKAVYLYDDLERLVEVSDSWGHKLVLAYDGTTHEVTSITNTTSGRSLVLTWAGDGPSGASVVKSATAAPAPGAGPAPKWTYSYTGGRLTSVCAPPQSDPDCTEYSYWADSASNGRKGKLNTVTKPEGLAEDKHAVELDYGSDGRVTTASNSLGKTWTFSDDDDAVEGTYHPIAGISAGTRTSVDPGQTITQDMTPAGSGIPNTGVQAVVVDIAASNASANGYLNAYANDGSVEPPGGSMVAYVTGGDVRSTLATVPVSDDGVIKVTNHTATVDLNFEVIGWYGKSGVSGGSVFVPLPTKSILDTRTAEDGDDPVHAGDGAVRDVQITGKGGIPTDGVTAVVYSLEGISPTATTWMTAFPKNETRPAISNLWLNSGRITDNLAITKVGQDGKISLYNKTGDIDVTVNVVGYFTDPAIRDGLVFRPVPQTRLLDTRVPGGQWASPWPTNTTRPIATVGLAGLPARGVEAVVGDVQGIGSTAASSMRTSPAGSTATGVTYVAQNGQSVGNQVYAGLGDDGSFDLTSTHRSMDVVIDVTGYFTSIPRTTLIQDPLGNQVEFRFDSLGRLVSRIDEDGFAKLNGYNDEGMLAATIEPTSDWTFFEYDDDGHLISQQVSHIAPNWAATWSGTTRFGYIEDEANKARDGKLAWVSDPRSSGPTDTAYRTTYDYDDHGQPTTVTGPSIDGAAGVGVVRTYTTSTTVAVGGGTAPAGLLATSTDASGLVTRYFYDNKGDLRRVEHPSAEEGGARTRRDEFTYDALGRATQQKQISKDYPAGLVTDRVYDDQGRVVEETGPLVTGLIQHPVEGKDHRTKIAREYDDDGRLHKETETDLVRNVSRWIQFTYDDAGHLTATLDSTGRETHRTYDANGNVDTTTGVDDMKVDYGYNARNLLTTATAKDVELDPIGHPGQLSNPTLATYAYDASGRRVTEIDASGRLVNNVWRADGKLEASIAGNIHSTDPVTGAPTPSQRSMLLGGAELDWAGHPLEQYEPSDVEYGQSSWTSLSGWTASTPANWTGTSSTITSSTPGVLRHDGRSDGSVEVVANGPAPLLPAFRITANRSRYHRVVLTDGVLKLQSVKPGVNTDLAQLTLSQPIVAGDRIAAVFVGPRIWVLLNGVVVLDVYDSVDEDEAGVGLAQSTAANQSSRTFRFDAYRRTVNSFDSYGRIETSIFDPGGADQRTDWTRKADGRPTRIALTRATNPTLNVVQAVEYDYDAATGALDWQDAIIENGENDERRRTDISIDDRGLTKSVLTPEGRKLDTTFDQLGRPLQTKTPARTVDVYGQQPTTAQPTTTFGYSSFGQPVAVQDAAGQLTWDWLDERGNPGVTVLPQYTPPGGTPQDRRTVSTFDEASRPLSTTDFAGKTTDFTYNSLGQLVQQQDPAAGSDPRGKWRFEYDNVGRLVHQTNPLDAEVVSHWDDLDRLVATEQEVTQPSGSIATFVQARTFGNGGGLVATHSAEGVVTAAAYDLAGRLTRTADAAGNATNYGYDELSRLADVTGPDNRRVHSIYDLVGDKTREEYFGPTGGTALGASTFTWNKDHQLMATQTPEGQVQGFSTSFGYDAAGQLISRTAPVSAGHSMTETWAYDQLGRPTKHVDGRLNETRQTYNSMGLPEDSIVPAAGAQTAVADRRWRTVYDSSGRPTTQSSPGGVSVSTTYDELGRPTQVSGTGAESPTETRNYQYDLLGQVKRVSTSAGAQNFTYDERGMLVSATGGSGDSWFSYDGDGRVTQRVDSSGTSSFTYDNRGLPDTMTSSLTGSVSFDFDSAGRPTTVDYGSNTKRTFSYNPWGDVQSEKLTTGTGPTPPVLYGTDYTYDLDGNIKTKTTSGSGVPAAGTNSYTYDRASRMTGWSGPGTTPQTYAWDDASNRAQAGATTAQYDAQNRLTQTSSPDGVTTNTWNANGTMDTQSVAPAQRKVTLVVTNPASLTSAETTLSNHLSAAGALVALVDDAAAASATNVDVVVIAPTVDAATLADKYKTLGVPVVNLAAATWQASGLTSAAPASASGTSAHAAQPTHPVAAGKTGTVTLLSSANTLNNASAASLGSGATKVWATTSSSTDTVAAVYDAGATTPAGAAPARRVTVGLSAGAIGSLNADGWAVLDAAIVWADNNPLKAGTTAYDFDAFEQLRKITPPTGGAVNYAYDPLGRRLSSPTGPLSYSGTGIRPSSDGATRYQPGPIGTIAVDDMTAGAGKWAHADSHTDVVGTFTPGATTLAGAQTFSPWGQPMGTTGTPSPLGYQSERQDLPGGLVGMGVRENNPDTATFISHDPITDPAVPNGYSYTPSNPMGWTDPTGMHGDGCHRADRSVGDGNVLEGRWCYFGDGNDREYHWHQSGIRDCKWPDDRYLCWGGAADTPTPPPATPVSAPCGYVGRDCDDDAGGVPSPRGRGNGHGGDGGSRGNTTPGGSGADASLLARTPAPPMSDTARQVHLTGSAVPNYPGRHQRDHNGQMVDTGAASIATAPTRPTSVRSSNVVSGITPQVIEQMVQAGDDGAQACVDFFNSAESCAAHSQRGGSSNPIGRFFDASQDRLGQIGQGIAGLPEQGWKMLNCLYGKATDVPVGGMGSSGPRSRGDGGRCDTGEGVGIGEMVKQILCLNEWEDKARFAGCATTEGLLWWLTRGGSGTPVDEAGRGASMATAKAEAEALAAELRSAPSRAPTMATAAVDRTTGEVFTGASGTRTVRPASLDDLLPSQSLEPWPVANCAEVAACAAAIASGSRLEDLDIYTVRTKTGQYAEPCLNCETWIPGE